MKTLLSIAAHPDDESLSYGALLKHAAQLGWKIHLAWATVGEKSSSDAASSRWREALQVATRLNATAENFGLADGHVKVDELIPVADRLIRQLKPDVIVWPCGTSPEQHQDHRALHDSMLNAAGRSKYGTACWCIGQPPVDPDPWFCQPHLYLGFSEDHLRISMSLMGTYKSEEEKHFAKPEFLHSRARQWAARTRTGVAFAEPFMLVKGIPEPQLFSCAIESNAVRCLLDTGSQWDANMIQADVKNIGAIS